MGALAPASSQPSDVPTLLRSLLPKRSEEDKAAEIIRVTFGRGKHQREFEIPVLATRPNRKWKEQFGKELETIFDTDAGKKAKKVSDGISFMSLLMRMTDEQMTLLRAYDRDGILPDAEWMEDNATDNQILTAFLGVTAAAFPFELTLAEMVLNNRPMWEQLKATFWARMSSSLLSTAGPRVTSKPN